MGLLKIKFDKPSTFNYIHNMSGDVNAINSWARSLGQRARAMALNTGCSAADAKEHLISGKPLARGNNGKGEATLAAARKVRTGV